MANRDAHPMKRTAREEARVWPVAVALVALYLLVAHWAEQRADYEADSFHAPAWQTKDGER